VRIIQKLLFIGAALVLLLKCASNSDKIANPNLGGTNVLFELDVPEKLKKDTGTGTCNLVFSTLGFPPKINVVKSSDQSRITVGKVPNEDIKLTQIYCNGKKSVLKSAFNPEVTRINIQKNKTHYLGMIVLYFLEDGGFSFYVKASESKRFLKNNYEQVTATDKENLVSPYSGKALTAELINAAPEKRGVDFKAEVPGEKAQQDKMRLNASVKKCANDEDLRNPLHFGNYKFEASFLDGKFESFEVKENNNVYTQQFTDCLKQSFKSYIPLTQKRIKYVLSI
jgi:hypothetical protein